jgi:hypothetical protein
MIPCLELIHIISSSLFVFCVSIHFESRQIGTQLCDIRRHELRHSEVPVANVCVRCPNCHLFRNDCCLVFTTSLCKSSINFTGIRVYTMFTHAFKAISQGIERVPRVESSRYCRVGRSFSTCILHTRGGSAEP